MNLENAFAGARHLGQAWQGASSNLQNGGAERFVLLEPPAACHKVEPRPF
jgi:hypothetical protein